LSRLSHIQVEVSTYPASRKVTKDFVFVFAEIFSRRSVACGLRRNIFEAVCL
jgi:hypothetical protein